jgi:hypothetical protein
MRGARPQFWIELSSCARRENVDICMVANHGEARGTRAGHQRGANFWLFE